jgi:hypothetical protein
MNPPLAAIKSKLNIDIYFFFFIKKIYSNSCIINLNLSFIKNANINL